jgi:hypothetical protein
MVHIVGAVLDSVHMPARHPCRRDAWTGSVVVTVDGATPAPAGSRLPRLLRRGLLAVAVAVAGWLLSVLFAGAAAADEIPSDTTPVQETHTTAVEQEPAQGQSGGLLGGLLGGVVHTVGSLTQVVVDLTGSVLETATAVLAPVVQPPAAPIFILPAHHDGPSSDSAETDRADDVAAIPAVVAPAPVVPVAPPVAPPVVEAPAPEIHLIVAVPAQVTQPTPVTAPAPGNAAEHAGKGDTDPQPEKTPTAPAGPGSTVSTGHDSFGGARGTHGVLASQATLHPADAGFTTRSRAVNAAGRGAGLPATSPD